MNILILGSGGREHALAWAVKQNPKTDRLIVAPGNAGIAMLAECAEIDILDGAAVAAFLRRECDRFRHRRPRSAAGRRRGRCHPRRRHPHLRPLGQGAQLEASKAFTKEICDAAGAPTAAWARFTEAEPARAYIRARGAPIVVKADGLAAGKGVVVALTEAEALAAIDDMFAGQFGAAGAEVVIEEFMAGEEASFFLLTDGTTVLPIGTAQDHKRAFDGDTGPNTGAWAPTRPPRC